MNKKYIITATKGTIKNVYELKDYINAVSVKAQLTNMGYKTTLKIEY